MVLNIDKHSNARLVGGRRVVAKKKVKPIFNEKELQQVYKTLQMQPLKSQIKISKIVIIKSDLSQKIFTQIEEFSIIKEANCFILSSNKFNYENLPANQEKPKEEKAIEERIQTTKSEKKLKRDLLKKQIIKKFDDGNPSNVEFEINNNMWTLSNGEIWIAKNNNYYFFGELKLKDLTQEQIKEQNLLKQLQIDEDIPELILPEPSKESEQLKQQSKELAQLIESSNESLNQQKEQSNESSNQQKESSNEPKFPDEDINMVIVGVGSNITKEQAITALKKHGNVVDAVMWFLG